MTQVVSPTEGIIFHSRLAHSLKVGQVARRLADNLLRTQFDVVKAAGGIDPEIAEAAGLAHDIGHPPFGHAAEDELRRLIAAGLGEPEDDPGAKEGYEGNAQAFRVLTKLAPHRSAYAGLDLTDRTLCAVLKYPWTHDPSNPLRRGKYGAYATERDELEWATDGRPEGHRSLEAEVMDLADDLTYSVHDLQDFFRAGLIDPVPVLRHLDEHLQSWFDYLDRDALKKPSPRKRTIARAARNLDESFYAGIVKWVLGEEAYTSSLDARTTLDLASSETIGRLVRTAEVRETNGAFPLHVPEETLVHLRFLQRIVWTEVIESPRLASIQCGQRRIVRELFQLFHEWIEARAYRRLPPMFSEMVLEAMENANKEESHALSLRFAGDIVASLTDREAVIYFQRVTGVSLGAITDLLPTGFA